MSEAQTARAPDAIEGLPTGRRRKAAFALGMGLMLSVLDASMSNVALPAIAKDLNEKYGVDPRRTASLLDIFSCSFQGLVPYGAQLLSAAAVVGISPLAITPYCWYPMLIIVFGVLAILMGLPKFQDTALDEYGNAILLVPKSEV